MFKIALSESCTIQGGLVLQLKKTIRFGMTVFLQQKNAGKIRFFSFTYSFAVIYLKLYLITHLQGLCYTLQMPMIWRKGMLVFALCLHFSHVHDNLLTLDQSTVSTKSIKSLC